MTESVLGGVGENKIQQADMPKFGRSFLWLLLFLSGYILGPIIYFIGYGIVLGISNPSLIGRPEFNEFVQQQAQLHAVSPSGMGGMMLANFFVIMPILLFASQFRAQTWQETLGLRGFRLKTLGMWLLVLLAYLLIQSFLSSTFGVEETEFLISISGSRSVFLAVVMITVAPVLEELLFRGYLFKAWRYSCLGLTGTLLLTSLIFSLLHVGQYSWLLLFFLFSFSVILGLAREKSGSVWVPILLHSTNNIVSAVFLVYIGLS